MQGILGRITVDIRKPRKRKTGSPGWGGTPEIRTRNLSVTLHLRQNPSETGSEGSLRRSANSLVTGSDLNLVGSPRTPKIRTFRSPLSVGFYVAGPTGMNGRVRRRALRHVFLPDDLINELPVPKPPPEPKPDRASRFQQMIDSGMVGNRAELARLLGCSRAWVTKVLGSGAIKA